MNNSEILSLISQNVNFNMSTRLSDIGVPDSNKTISNFLIEYKLSLLLETGKITESAFSTIKELINIRTILENQVVILYLNGNNDDELEKQESLIKKINSILNQYDLFKLKISLEDIIKKEIEAKKYQNDTVDMKVLVKTCKESINK